MEKKIVGIVLAITFVLAMLPVVLFGIFCCDVYVNDSPNGDYQIVSLWIDEGGFGYGGAHYIKEKGLFSEWHKIEKVPSACEWISDTQFTVYRPRTSGEDRDKIYDASDFFDK